MNKIIFSINDLKTLIINREKNIKEYERLIKLNEDYVAINGELKKLIIKNKKEIKFLEIQIKKEIIKVNKNGKF